METMVRILSILFLCLPCFGQVAFTFTDQPFLSSDGEFSPPAIPTIKLWLDAAIGVTSQGGDGTAIWKWEDQSGLDNDVYNVNGSGSTNFTGGPTYHTTGGPNSLPYIHFGSGLLRSDASLSMTQPNTYFAVCNWDTFNFTTKFLFDGVTVGSRNAYIHASANSLYAGSQPNFGDMDISAFTVVTFIFDVDAVSIEGRMRTNSVELAATTIPPQVGSNPMGRIVLGKAQNNTATWTGGIAEFIAYNALLTTNQCIQVETYLMNKYGL